MNQPGTTLPIVRAAPMGPLHPRAVICRAQNLAIAAAERSYAFRARTCPCCGWSGLRFRTLAVREYMRTGAMCPGCGSLERHRALAGFYPKFFAALGRRPDRLIHFAPEPSLRPILQGLCNRYETSAYGETTPADWRLDLTRLMLPDVSCDALVLNHVLDSMADDLSAVPEMYRVLRPGGAVVGAIAYEVGVPTRETPTMSTFQYRIFGSVDIAARFAPFEASVINAAQDVPSSVRRAQGIPAIVWVLVLRR